MQGIKGLVTGPVELGTLRVTTAATFLQSCAAWVPGRVVGPAARNKLKRNTASVIKIGFFLLTFLFREVVVNIIYSVVKFSSNEKLSFVFEKSQHFRFFAKTIRAN